MARWSCLAFLLACLAVAHAQLPGEEMPASPAGVVTVAEINPVIPVDPLPVDQGIDPAASAGGPAPGFVDPLALLAPLPAPVIPPSPPPPAERIVSAQELAAVQTLINAVLNYTGGSIANCDVLKLTVSAVHPFPASHEIRSCYTGANRRARGCPSPPLPLPPFRARRCAPQPPPAAPAPLPLPAAQSQSYALQVVNCDDAQRAAKDSGIPLAACPASCGFGVVAVGAPCAAAFNLAYLEWTAAQQGPAFALPDFDPANTSALCAAPLDGQQRAQAFAAGQATWLATLGALPACDAALLASPELADDLRACSVAAAAAVIPGACEPACGGVVSKVRAHLLTVCGCGARARPRPVLPQKRLRSACTAPTPHAPARPPPPPPPSMTCSQDPPGPASAKLPASPSAPCRWAPSAQTSGPPPRSPRSPRSTPPFSARSRPAECPRTRWRPSPCPPPSPPSCPLRPRSPCRPPPAPRSPAPPGWRRLRRWPPPRCWCD